MSQDTTAHASAPTKSGSAGRTNITWIPFSRPMYADRPSLCTTLPPELRLMICDHLVMDASGVDQSYDFTGLSRNREDNLRHRHSRLTKILHKLLPKSWLSYSGLDKFLYQACTDPEFWLKAMEDMREFLLDCSSLKERETKLATFERFFGKHIRFTAGDDVNKFFLGRRLQYNHALLKALAGMEMYTLPRITKTHSMILVSKQLGAEYIGAYAKRINFFFQFDRFSLFGGATDFWKDGYDCKVAPIPAFFRISPDLVANLRRCSIIVGLEQVEFAAYDRSAPEVRFSRLMPILDEAFTSTIYAFLRHMRKLHTLRIEWCANLVERGPLGTYESIVNQSEANKYNGLMFIERFKALTEDLPCLRHFAFYLFDPIARHEIQLHGDLLSKGEWELDEHFHKWEKEARPGAPGGGGA